ncbi:MAG: hypothetical protein WDN44_14965 [Sphingomonas sp.]
MRAILSKVVAVSMIAGAGLLVTACKSETTATVNNTEEVTTENVGVSEDMTGATDAANGTIGNVVTTNTTETTTNTTTNTQ